MNRHLIAVFTGSQALLDATHRARAAGYEIYDAFTPYAVHGLDHAMGIRRSRLTWVCFGAAMAGLAFAVWLQVWTSSVDWPLVIGGKPFNSLPAFVPVAFEMAVLVAGITLFITLWARSRLWPGKRAVFPVPGLTDDRFALVLRASDAGFDADAARTLMLGAGAIEVHDIGGNDGW